MNVSAVNIIGIIPMFSVSYAHPQLCLTNPSARILCFTFSNKNFSSAILQNESRVENNCESMDLRRGSNCFLN